MTPALAQTKKKHSLRNGKLKASRASATEDRNERLRIRRVNKKTENHKKLCLSTLKRLKRGDENELGRYLRLGEGGRSGWPWRQKKKEEQDWRMMQLPNGSGWRWRWTKKEKQDWRRW